MSEKKFLDHGGSVPGWLTDKGKALLGALREIRPQLEVE